MSLVSPVPLIEALGDSCREIGSAGAGPDQVFDDLAINGVNFTGSAPAMGQPSADAGLTSLVMGNRKPTAFNR